MVEALAEPLLEFDSFGSRKVVESDPGVPLSIHPNHYAADVDLLPAGG